ncbi:MAG: hypothetical protein WCF65_04315 [Parachlamydiaceae bacterium]
MIKKTIKVKKRVVKKKVVAHAHKKAVGKKTTVKRVVAKKTTAKKAVVKKTTVRKAVVRKAKPAAKSVTKKAVPKAGVRPKVRVQTAEGWVRCQVRARRAKKKA